MYAKLFSRITESSLMEEPINVRYVFVMMLAIADPKGYVIGTDVAIARRLNMPTNEFQRCADVLMQPDEDSNSKEEEGRRILQSDGERGYKIVNYLTYRDMQDQEQRREYMRTYMQKRREKKRVNSVNNGKLQLTQAEAKAEGEEKETNTDTSCLDAERLVGEELEELKDRLLRELPVNPLAPTELEFRTFVYQNCPLLNKLRSPTLWYDMHGFYQWKGNKWIPVQDWKKYVTSLEEKKFKSNPRCKVY